MIGMTIIIGHENLDVQTKFNFLLKFQEPLGLRVFHKNIFFKIRISATHYASA